MTTGPRASERWPPLAAAALALILIFLVLPNPFRVPQENPTSTLEYAPDPNPQQDANLGDTDLATSGGIGSGGLGEGLLPGDPPPSPPPQLRPRQKQCVGDPPRQTEDPLSPPCVPFFDGDNGGRTYPGVTKDEVKVVFYNASGVEGDMSRPWQPSDESPDHRSDFNETYLVRTIKAQLRYFQSRYQTYGRRVHVFAQNLRSGVAGCQQAAGEAGATYIDYAPFAAVDFTQLGACYVSELAEEFKVLSFGVQWDVLQEAFDDHGPYIFGFYPSAEVEARWSATFLCDVLRKGTARFAGDESMHGRQRRFGLIWNDERNELNRFWYLGDLLRRYMKQECGMSFAQIQRYDGMGDSEAPTIMQRFKSEDVTTVVCYCSPYPPGRSTVTFMQGAATQIDYFPEWFWDHGSRMFRAIWNQESADEEQSRAHFGVTHFWRGKAFQEQQHYQAYLEMEPGTVPNTRFNFDIYHLFLNLFSAIQAAGPELTPEAVERGMFTFRYADRRNPYVPTGGYGPRWSPKATSNYTFVDTAMGWWWDPDGTPPGGQDGEGCLRVMNEGLRYFKDEWPRDDRMLFADGAPCSQDNTEILSPTSDT